MRAVFLTKIILMLIALGAVIWAIRSLNSPGTTSSLNNAFQALGLQAGGAGSPGLQAAGRELKASEERFNLCRTRIVGVEFGSGRKIEEARDGFKVKWLASDPQSREISTLEVEKWLTQHCQIVIQVVDPSTTASFNSEAPLTFHYVDNSSLILKHIDGHYFQIDGRTVDSTDLARALIELQEIALFQPASGL